MPKCLGSLHHAPIPQFAARPKSFHVWIPDELLATTFNSFVHSHCRHGSNVPGPLEAQRRANKRKLTSTTRDEFSGVNLGLGSTGMLDAHGLFAAQPSEAWWKKPETAEEAHPRAWRDWLSSKWSRSPAVGSSTTPLEVQAPEYVIEDIGAQQEPLLKRFESVQSCSDLVALLDESCICLSHNPQLAEQLLALAAEQGWTNEQIAVFLLEPSLNPLAAATYTYFFRYADRYSSILKYLIESRTITRAIGLGLVSADELRVLYSSRSAVEASLGKSLDWTKFCMEILDALDESKVLHLRDLGGEFSRSWLSYVVKHDFDPLTPDLLWRLLQPFSKDDADTLSKVITISIGMVDPRTMDHLPKLADLLSRVPIDMANKAIFTATRTLMDGKPQPRHIENAMEKVDAEFRRALQSHFRTLSKVMLGVSEKAFDRQLPRSSADEKAAFARRMPTDVELWYATLAILPAVSGSKFSLSTLSFRAWIKDAQRPKEKRRRCIAGLWSAVALASQHNSVLRDFDSGDVKLIIYELFHHNCWQRGEDILAVMLDILRCSRLTAKDKFLRRLHVLTEGEFLVTTKYSLLQSRLKNLRAYEVGGLQGLSFHRSVKYHFPWVLKKVAESANADLAAFEQQCKDLILKTKGHSFVVFHLLSHNLALKNALALGRRWANPKAGSSADLGNQALLGGYNYNQLVGMINSLARACADSPHLTTRSALRKVWWLHTYLNGHGGTITYEMRRAMWQIATLGPQPRGKRTTKQLYDLVVEAEGLEAAKQMWAITLALKSSRERTQRKAVNKLVHDLLPPDQQSALSAEAVEVRGGASQPKRHTRHLQTSRTPDEAGIVKSLEPLLRRNGVLSPQEKFPMPEALAYPPAEEAVNKELVLSPSVTNPLEAQQVDPSPSSHCEPEFAAHAPHDSPASVNLRVGEITPSSGSRMFRTTEMRSSDFALPSSATDRPNPPSAEPSPISHRKSATTASHRPPHTPKQLRVERISLPSGRKIFRKTEVRSRLRRERLWRS